MATITTRSGKGSPLTNSEVDANFTNLNTDKTELDDLSVSTASASGGGSLSYANSTGVFTFTPPDLTSYLTGLGSNDTDDLSEGSTNLYFTDARARGAVSVTDSGGDGSLAYNSSTGVITYTGPSASEVRAHISGGTGVTVTSGEIAIGQAVATNSNVTFNNVQADGNITVTGNLTVNGTTTTINSATVTIDDPIFTLGGDTAPASDDNKDRGIEFRWHNGSAAKVGFFGYDDSASAFTFIADATNTSEVFSGTAGDVVFGGATVSSLTLGSTAITATGAEINYVDGVTSNIQTQLDAKQASDAQLTDIAGLTPSDGGFIVGDGSNFVVESGATAIASLGITASAAELNKLDGVTATTAEINYVDGVTSNVQTQLDAKQASNQRLTDISGLTHSDGSFIVSDGSNFVLESGSTARTSLGVAIGSDVQAYNASLADIAGLSHADSSFIVSDGSNFVLETGDTVRTSLGLAIGTDVQAYDAQLADVAGLTPTDGNFIVGNGSNFTTESGATARASLGLAIGTDVLAYDSNLQSFVTAFTLPTSDGTANQILKTDGSGTLSFTDDAGGVDTSGTPVANDFARFTDADTIEGRSYAEVRTDLGLVIGTNVQAFDQQLADIAGLTPTDGNIIIGDGSNFVLESGATARTSLGLAIGTDVQAYDANNTTSTNTQTLTNKTLSDAVFQDGYTEEVYSLTGTDLDQDNGTFQTKVISGAVTFTESLASGQSLILHLEGGASYTVTWPTITWVTSDGNNAPTLTAKDTLIIWKISTTLYGAYVGSYA